MEWILFELCTMSAMQIGVAAPAQIPLQANKRLYTAEMVNPIQPNWIKLRFRSTTNKPFIEPHIQRIHIARHYSHLTRWFFFSIKYWDNECEKTSRFLHCMCQKIVARTIFLSLYNMCLLVLAFLLLLFPFNSIPFYSIHIWIVYFIRTAFYFVHW